MKLKNLRIERNNKTRLCIDVIYNKKKETLWYEVDSKFEKYLCTELADSFLVALLLFAMKNNEDLEIEGVPVTDTLLFNLNNYLIPTIARNIKKYNKIKIISEGADLFFEGEKHNGTGISRGVDSFCTINEFTNGCPSHMKVDFLTFFNIGAHGEYDSKKAYNLFEKRRVTSEKFALENNFNFIAVNSNISDFIMMDFESSHTFRNLSIVFALQKLFKNYYYSSGINIEDFKIAEKSTAYYDIYIMYLLSTKNIRFYSSGAALSRLDKTKIISGYEPSYDNLSVCFRDDKNCGKCEKCVRTMFELYSANNLEKYSKSFDIANFYKNKNWYETKFFEFYFRKKGKSDYRKTYIEMKNNKIRINKINIVKGYCIALIKDVYQFLKKLK